MTPSPHRSGKTVIYAALKTANGANILLPRMLDRAFPTRLTDAIRACDPFQLANTEFRY